MKKSRLIYALVLALPLLLSQLGWAGKIQVDKDYHSYSNPHEIRIEHMILDLKVMFDKKQIRGIARLVLDRPDPRATELVLDTRDLDIQKALIEVDGKWIDTDFSLDKADPAFGQALRIKVPSKNKEVRIHYMTSNKASGLQWLTPEQTAGKKYPFLFTQAQAIHARSFIPLQDTPQVRFTYKATVRTPKNLRAVMSAKNFADTPTDGIYRFHMPQAIPSYLMALAVGDLKFKAMGKRTGVYAEAYILDAAAKEFEDTESMLEATEAKFGPYSWGRYDLLILPPSFPFGGMENPRISFITPTVIAGDKSLVSLIAHELAHSWSGNSVTNATWRDLWLNEGFTTYLTYRIMEITYGTDRFNMEAVLGYQDLLKSIERLDAKDQVLAIDLRGRDPDDSFSNIPYEKGALFLRELEYKIGRESFDIFIKEYFNEYAFKSLYTEAFLEYLEENLIKKFPKKLSMERVKQWVYEPGIPEGAPIPESDAFGIIDSKRDLWLDDRLIARKIRFKEWTVHEWLYFLNNMPEILDNDQLAELDRIFNLTASSNNEILHSWLLMCIRNRYKPAYERLEEYLISIGRRKLITPLYKELMTSEKGAKFARRVYEIARPGYHPLAQGTIDGIVLKK